MKYKEFKTQVLSHAVGQARLLADSIAVCIVLLLCIPIPEVCFRVDDYQIRYQ